MKRISSAFLQQSIKFVLNDKLSHDEAVQNSKREADEYVEKLEKSGIKYQILNRGTAEDGASTIEVKKQYNNAPTGNYF